jgi:hypothetical protein
MLAYLKKKIDHITLYIFGFFIYTFLYRNYINRIIHRLIAIFFMIYLFKHMVLFHIDPTLYLQAYTYKMLLQTLNFCTYHSLFFYKVLRDEYIKSPFYEYKFKCIMNFCFIVNTYGLYLGLVEGIYGSCYFDFYDAGNYIITYDD